jgi:hypothetical protein
LPIIGFNIAITSCSEAKKQKLWAWQTLRSKSSEIVRDQQQPGRQGRQRPQKQSVHFDLKSVGDLMSIIPPNPDFLSSATN